MAKRPSPQPTAADYIYQALVELMDKKPYGKITITDVTKKAGVSRMAFYRNYQSKDDILIGHYKQMLLKGGEVATQVSDKDFWLSFNQAGDRDPIVKYIMQAGLLMEMFDVTLDTAKVFFQHNLGTDLTDENQVLRLYLRLGTVWGYLLYLRDRQGNMSPDALAEQLARIISPSGPP